MQVRIATPLGAKDGTLHTLTLAANNRFNEQFIDYDPEESNYVSVIGTVANKPDQQSPYITCPVNITTTAASGQNSATVNFALPTVSDNQSNATVICTPASGAMFPVGVTVVNCVATDTAGNSASCSFNVTVTGSTDTQPPIIVCSPNITTAIPYGQSSVLFDYAPPQVSDDRMGVTFSCSPASGSTFYRGITPVTCTATDASGNTSSCAFNVTIYDVSIQDDRSGDTLLFNSITGDYIFYRCGASAFTLSGRGTITRQGCLVKLGGDPKVSATLDSCVINPANRGSATIKPNPIGGWIYLTDSNTTNNLRPCPNG